MKGALLLFLLVLTILMVGSRTTRPVGAVSWGSTTAIPGADPYDNSFPKIVQSSNGSLWLVWAKLIGTYHEVYLMVNNGVGWSGQIPIVNSNGASDDIDPTIAQMSNGTIILVWSKGASGAAGCFGTTAYDLFTQSYTNNKWSNPIRLVQAAGDDISPALTRLRDGRLFLTWSKCTTTNGYGDLYYKTYDNTWGPDTSLVATSAEEKLPAVTQTYDGRVWVAYSTDTTGTNLIYYVTWNGTSWTSPTQLTNTPDPDDWPSIVQDRSGTIWTFWARFLPNGTVQGQPSYQFDIFYKNSTNNGSNWSPDQAVATLINSDEKEPYLIQNTDKKLYLVYSSSQRLGNPYGTLNLYMTTSGIVKAHDLAVTSVTPSSKVPRVGEQVNLTASITNLGDYTDSSTLNYYANSTLVNSQPVTLTPGQTSTITLPWDSTGRPTGQYIAKATVTQVPGEVVTLNNSLNTTITLLARGDVNRDGRVDIVDLTLVASHYGTTRGSPNWLSNSDLNHDGVIDITDLGICGADFGKIVGVPDLAVILVKLPTVNPRTGEIVTANVTVTNLGSIVASTQVNLYSNQTLINTLPVTVSPGQNIILTFTWNSTGQKAGRYVVRASIVPASGEIVTSNNSLNSTLLLTFRGDTNRDGRVDISDLALVAAHLGSVQGGPGYLADADLNRDKIIDIIDLTTCGADFGKTLF